MDSFYGIHGELPLGSLGGKTIAAAHATCARRLAHTLTSPTHPYGPLPEKVVGDHGTYIGGYRVKYEHKFTFATVRGAGHMCAETRPEPTLALVERTVLGGGL